MGRGDETLVSDAWQERMPAADDTPIGVAFSRLAAEDPERVALTFEGSRLTRGELETRTNRLAHAYLGLGVEHNSLVTIGLPNGVEFVEAALAAWKAGATPQPVSSRLPPIERQKLLELASPAIAVGFAPDEADCPALPAEFVPDPALPDSLPDAPVATSWKAPTSGGSTGRPKLIKDRRPATAEVCAWMAYLFCFGAGDVTFTTAPLYHNAPFSHTAAALLSGASVVLGGRFDAATALDLIEREKVTWMYAVPTMMHRIMRLPEEQRAGADLTSLRTVFHTGAPCSPWLKRAWIDWLGPDAIREIYAATEAHAATAIGGSEWLEHEGSVGRVISGEIKVLDSTGRQSRPGAVGEIWMRPADGKAPPYEYVGSDPRRSGEGWESLGDLGRFDEDSYLYLADRETDMILCGGANIFPAEIEASLDEHPAVISSCAVGLPHEDLGNAVHALVQLSEPVDDEALLEFLSERLVRYKLPRSFERVDFPLRDDAGKVRRSALRQERLERSQTA